MFLLAYVLHIYENKYMHHYPDVVCIQILMNDNQLATLVESKIYLGLCIFILIKFVFIFRL